MISRPWTVFRGDVKLRDSLREKTLEYVNRLTGRSEWRDRSRKHRKCQGQLLEGGHRRNGRDMWVLLGCKAGTTHIRDVGRKYGCSGYQVRKLTSACLFFLSICFSETGKIPSDRKDGRRDFNYVIAVRQMEREVDQ